MKKSILIGIALVVATGWALWWWMQLRPLDVITVIDDGNARIMHYVRQGLVAEALAQADITMHQEDKISPAKDVPLKNGMTITIARKKVLHVVQGNQKKDITVHGKNTVREALDNGGIVYDDDDIISVPLTDDVYDDMYLTIIAVTQKEQKIQEKIPFTTTQKEDPQKKKGTREVTQKGASGTKELTYSIIEHDGKEVSRTLIREEILKKPRAEIITVGTYEVPPPVKLGKKHNGAASWYANKGCDCAANPWLPFGSRVKVTNKANGKSVVVTINDRGPFVAGRIIDLDKVAWQKIAPLGAGVIDVVMQEVKK